MQRLARPDPVFYPVAQRPLVGLELYKEIPSILSDLVDDVLLHGHGVGSDYLSCHVYLINEPGHGLYLVALFMSSLGSQRDTGGRGICRDDVQAVPARQHGAAQCLAVNADYLHTGFVLE